MPRVTEVVGHFYEFDEEGFTEWCEENGVDPVQVLRWSSQFGTAMHRWCIEGIAPKRPSKVQQACYDHWARLVKEKDIKILHKEQKVQYKELYHGRLDLVLEIDEIISISDLKFWKCWRWAPCIGFEHPTEYKHPAGNLTKTNLQLELYDKAQKLVDSDARTVIAINPLGAHMHTFSRRPKDKFKEAIEWLEKESADIDF